MARILVDRLDGIVEVLLLPHKDGSGYSFVNLTKGHICPCRFGTMEDAIRDLESRPEVLGYEILDGGMVSMGES